jgi:hypothetical protein
VDSATEKFLSEGLSRFAEAQATVKAYEEAAAEKVGEIAEGDTERLRGKKGKAKILYNNVCYGEAGGRVAYAQFMGVWRREDVKWETGIWWEHPSKGTTVAAYVECRDGPDALEDETWAKPPGSAPGKWEAFKSGLQVELDPMQDITAQFRRLLDEAAAQLEAMK